MSPAEPVTRAIPIQAAMCICRWQAQCRKKNVRLLKEKNTRRVLAVQTPSLPLHRFCMNNTAFPAPAATERTATWCFGFWLLVVLLIDVLTLRSFPTPWIDEVMFA